MRSPDVPLADLLHTLRIEEVGAGSSATRPAVDAALSGSDAFLFFGHGTANRLQGRTDLVDSSNAGSLADSVVFAIACSLASGLGLISDAKAYVGFTDLLAFLAGDPDDEFGAYDKSRLVVVGSGSTIL